MRALNGAGARRANPKLSCLGNVEAEEAAKPGVAVLEKEVEVEVDGKTEMDMGMGMGVEVSTRATDRQTSRTNE